MSDEPPYKLRFPIWSKGRCVAKGCSRKGDGLSGTLMNLGVSRSVGPVNVHIQLGPYCKHCGGRLRIEMELMMKVQEIS